MIAGQLEGSDCRHTLAMVQISRNMEKCPLLRILWTGHTGASVLLTQSFSQWPGRTQCHVKNFKTYVRSNISICQLNNNKNQNPKEYFVGIYMDPME
jgi:hypothetical protein